MICFYIKKSALSVVCKMGFPGGESGGNCEASVDAVGLVQVRDDGGLDWGSRVGGFDCTLEHI